MWRAACRGVCAQLENQYTPELFGGLTVIKGQGLLRSLEGWKDVLYQPVRRETAKALQITALLYCIWGNRGLGKMAVWLDATR